MGKCTRNSPLKANFSSLVDMKEIEILVRDSSLDDQWMENLIQISSTNVVRPLTVRQKSIVRF